MSQRPALGLLAAYVVGAVPCSWVVAKLARGVDLRDVGSGTVSGTGVYRVAGTGPLLVAGVLDVVKGAAAVDLARRTGGPATVPLAPAAAVSGHNWSPFLCGAGGRGIGPAIGALLPVAPAGSALLLAGIAGGKAVGHSAPGTLAAYAVLLPVLAARHGHRGAVTAAALLAPLLGKRLLGNRPASAPAAYRWRLLHDRDTRAPLP